MSLLQTTATPASGRPVGTRTSTDAAYHLAVGPVPHPAGTVALLVGLPLLHAHLAPRLGLLGLLGLLGTGLYLVGTATCAMAHLIVEAMVAVPLAPGPRDGRPRSG